MWLLNDDDEAVDRATTLIDRVFYGLVGFAALGIAAILIQTLIGGFPWA